MFLVCRVSSSRPKPRPSMPALFEMTVRALTPDWRTASINRSGMPQSPKPPAMIVMSSRNSPANAALASGYTFLILPPQLLAGPASFLTLARKDMQAPHPRLDGLAAAGFDGMGGPGSHGRSDAGSR